MMAGGHRYSGWPGAWCLDCGVADPGEEALAHGCDSVRCIHCEQSYPTNEEYCTPEREALGKEALLSWPHEIVWNDCGEHGNQECLEPGSKRFDPYAGPKAV